MYRKTRKKINSRDAIVVSELGYYSLKDTLECGQAFSFTKVDSAEGDEYVIPIGSLLVRVAQYELGELVFYGISDEDFDAVIVPYFSLNTNYAAISEDIKKAYELPWFKDAVDNARGIAILKQDAWETLFSFIVSQNNNIPRIRKILRRLCLEYGENLAEKNGITLCPISRHRATPCKENCGDCGICYSFPRAEDILAEPERLLTANPGFRYRYLLDAAESVCSGRINLQAIENMGSYEKSLEELKKVVGVGDKVASCTALFGLGNLDAFPIDVWMKRAIDTYFDGSLDPKIFGKYAGVAQQYIFHYIRNIENKQT